MDIVGVFLCTIFSLSSAQSPNSESYTLESDRSSTFVQSETHLEISTRKYGLEDHEKYTSEYFDLDGEITDINTEKPVLRKCCHFGEELTKEGCKILKKGDLPFHPVVYHSLPHVINESIPLEDIFSFEFGDTCQYGRYRLEPIEEPMDEFYLLDNGSLLLPAIPAMLAGTKEFCMEAFLTDEENEENISPVVLPLICFPPPDENELDDEELSWILYPIGLLISVPFLLLTLCTHMVIPELHRSLQGKCFMCHVISLTFAYLGLASIQLSKSMLPTKVCVTIAFAVQFAFIACFAWLNVMCFDIWRSIKKASLPSSSVEVTTTLFKRKRFLWYSLYAWLCPVCIIIVSMIMDLTPSIPASFIKPQFGVASCWFLSNDAALPYFYGPIGIMIFVNAALFLLTARRIILDHKNDSDTFRSKRNLHIKTLRNHNKIIKLCFTLFVLMGVNWTMEIISWATRNNGGKFFKRVWYVTDVCNSLQGVFIFIIFMSDCRVRFLLKRKCKSLGCSIDTDDQIDSNVHDTIPVTSILLSETNSRK